MTDLLFLSSFFVREMECQDEEVSTSLLKFSFSLVPSSFVKKGRKKGKKATLQFLFGTNREKEKVRKGLL